MEQRQESGASTERDIWAYVPVTVFAVIGFSTLFTMSGTRPSLFAGPLLTELQIYVLNVFMHSGVGHFVGNMFLLVLFGGVLTLLTSNKHVLGIIFVSHVGGATLLRLTAGSIGIGSSLAVAGLVAATVVYSVGLVLGKTSEGVLEKFLGGAFTGLVLLGFGLLSVSGIMYLRLLDHHFGGWLFGALAETIWLVAGDRITG
jgi:hypothetical protein